MKPTVEQRDAHRTWLESIIESESRLSEIEGYQRGHKEGMVSGALVGAILMGIALCIIYFLTI
jgi:hypothetical protein